jgi:RNA polymerase sigma-70 factor (ECF subfamily)
VVTIPALARDETRTAVSPSHLTPEGFSISPFTQELGDASSGPLQAGPAFTPTGGERRPATFWPLLPEGRLERAREGDPSALGEFFDHYFPRIHATVLRLVRDTATAQDVTQDVLVKVQKALPHLDTGRDPAPWLFTIAVNSCRDLWRTSAWRTSQRSRSLEDPIIAGELHGAERPDEAFERAELTRLLDAAIGRLPEPLRVTIVLHDCEGLGHREIAEITGIDYAASRKRHSRALKALGEMLREVFSR